MTKPQTYFHLKLSEDETVVELTVHAGSKERAILLYEGLEKIINQLCQADLKLEQQNKS